MLKQRGDVGPGDEGDIGVVTEQPSRPGDTLPTGHLPSPNHLTFTPGLCLRWSGQARIRSAAGQSFVRRSMELKQRKCTSSFATIIPRKSHASCGLVHLEGVSVLETSFLQSL